MRKKQKHMIIGIVLITSFVAGALVVLMWYILSVPTHNTDSDTASQSERGSISVSGFIPPSGTGTISIDTSRIVENQAPLVSTDAMYITIVNGCDFNFSGECIRVRSGAGLDFPVVAKLRNDIVLKIDPKGQIEKDGHLWHKVVFDEFLQYPERVTTDWYVADDFVNTFTDTGIQTGSDVSMLPSTTSKRIIVDRSEQSLTAYEGETMVMAYPISTGLMLTPTPRGTFSIFRKTPTRYMQGPLKHVPSQYYDLPGVPWNLYFTVDGAVIHGAYWHNSFGHPYSHGCVNVRPEEARTLYAWADIGTSVIVTD